VLAITSTTNCQQSCVAISQIDEERTSFAYVNGNWDVVFPESVLTTYFNDDYSAPSGNHYSVLGIKKSSTSSDIKGAFRRLALQWHPDQCNEPDAAEVFMKINKAYEVLSDTSKKAKYDFALKLEQRTMKKDKKLSYRSYRPPLRCGRIKAKGVASGGKFVVSEILSWDDIIRDGKVLIVNFDTNKKEVVKTWIPLGGMS